MSFDAFHFAIVLCLVGGALFAAGPLIAAWLIAPNARGGDLGMPYECGMKPLGSPWRHFSISYYIYALLFIAFDVDVLYLYPVAVGYGGLEGWEPFVKLVIFLFFLFLALLYFKAKGVFTWPRKIDL
jgi:NADH:ubiquinone oxidoreductase subunit 3 (chain A)